jgi:hypothetical protein
MITHTKKRQCSILVKSQVMNPRSPPTCYVFTILCLHHNRTYSVGLGGEVRVSCFMAVIKELERWIATQEEL